MKAWFLGIFTITSCYAFAQYGPGGKLLAPIPDTGAGLRAQSESSLRQREAMEWEAYREMVFAQYQAAAQQAEIQKMLSRDPWRRIGNTTNYAGSAGWFEFQGTVQEIRDDGTVFKGKWGPILTIFTEQSDTTHLTTTQNSISQSYRTQATSRPNSQPYRSTTEQTVNRNAVTDTSINQPKIYGDDIFLVANFPYPTTLQQGFEEMMARESGYITYTNSARQVVTIHKLDYGTPCLKILSQEELAAIKERADAPKKAALKSNQIEADRGDAFGLLRMGERYRDGDGVEKDLAKAKEYLEKATAAGSPTAKSELAQLVAQPPREP